MKNTNLLEIGNIYKNSNSINTMIIDIKDISSRNLEELEKLQEVIDDRIAILKGRESLRIERVYSEEEADLFMSKCLKN